jgi:glycerophosphoryl diester phosphodiesterase
VLPFNLDLKTHGYELAALAALERHGHGHGPGRGHGRGHRPGLAKHTLISSVHSHSLRRLARARSGLRLGLSRGHLSSSFGPLASAGQRLSLRLMLPLQLRLAGATAVMLQHRVVDRSVVAWLHGRRLEVFTWTVDDETEAVRVRDAGVDGIASNDPARIKAALDRDEPSR